MSRKDVWWLGRCQVRFLAAERECLPNMFSGSNPSERLVAMVDVVTMMHLGHISSLVMHFQSIFLQQAKSLFTDSTRPTPSITWYGYKIMSLCLMEISYYPGTPQNR